MKALTLTQPWATLVAIGAKRFETRTWQTAYRGPIAIHAATGFPTDARILCTRDPFRKALAAAGYYADTELPRGCIVGVADLHGITSTVAVRHTLSAQELEFGNYDDGRFAWMLTGAWKHATTIPIKGKLGLWALPVGIERQLTF